MGREALGALVRRLRRRRDQSDEYTTAGRSGRELLLREVGRRDLILGLKLTAFDRSSVRETLSIFSYYVFAGGLMDAPHREVAARTEEFLERFDNSTAVDRLLDLGPDHPEAVARALQTLATTYLEANPSEVADATLRKVLSSEDPKRDIAETESLASAVRQCADFYQDIPSRGPLADLLGADARRLEAHAERLRGMSRMVETASQPLLRSSLQQRSTRILAALDEALQKVRRRWHHVADLTRDFHGIDKTPEQARLLVKNYRKDQQTRFGGARNRLEPRS